MSGTPSRTGFALTACISDRPTDPLEPVLTFSELAARLCVSAQTAPNQPTVMNLSAGYTGLLRGDHRLSPGVWYSAGNAWFTRVISVGAHERKLYRTTMRSDTVVAVSSWTRKLTAG